MSVKITSPIWNVSDLSPVQKLVLLKLADNANEMGVCWPSLTTIARDCCCSVRTVSRAISHFESINLLTHDRRYNKSNVYQFNMDTVTRLASNIDTMSIDTKSIGIDTMSSAIDTMSIGIDTVSSQYGHQCPTNHNEPSMNHQGTINEPSLDENDLDEDFDPYDPFGSSADHLKEMKDLRENG